MQGAQKVQQCSHSDACPHDSQIQIRSSFARSRSSGLPSDMTASVAIGGECPVVAPRKRMSGSVLQDAIVEMAHFRGWMVAHFAPAQVGGGAWRTPYKYDTEGFPDLVLVRERLVMAEVKGHGDTVRAEQEQWLSRLTEAGVEAYIWRPGDLTSGSIDRLLA